jgi:hypothetical protein
MRLVLNDSSGEKSVVLNSGPYDKRLLIKELVVGDKYAFRVRYHTESGEEASNLNFDFKNYVYDPVSGLYSEDSSLGSLNFKDEEADGYVIKEVISSDYNTEQKTREDFKLKIAISGTGTYYIETLEFFKASFSEGKVVPLAQ